jgi:site-specific recombinase XerC
MRTTYNTEFAKFLKEPYRTIYIIGTSNGLRVSDVIALKKERLSKAKPTIKEIKTGKSKRLYIPSKARDYIDTLCTLSTNDYVFCSKSKSGHISRQAVFKAFKKAATAAGVTDNIGTHTMRKNYAHREYEKSHDLNKVQKKLNHSNPAESALYIV